MSEPEVWDPLHDRSTPGEHWTTTNVRENVPGVPTPLTWALWRHASETGIRRAAYEIGAFSRSERELPSTYDQYYSRIFYGHFSLQLEWLTTLGDRLPGTSGQVLTESWLGRVPSDIRYRPTRHRYPIIAWRMPLVFLTGPRRIESTTRATDAWYHTELARLPGLDLSAATAMLAGAAERFAGLLALQTTAALGVVGPMYDALRRLTERTGVGDVGILSGTGGAEVSGLVNDLWQASRNELSLEQLVDRHGFHGPSEGELSAPVWRQEPESLRQMLRVYAARDDSQNPHAAEQATRSRRREMTLSLLQATPAAARPAARLLLKMAARRIPMRGIAKRGMLQSVDVARAAAAHIGEHLAELGRIDRVADLYYLTLDELTGAWPTDARELVARRRERRVEYQRLTLPSDWAGIPTPLRSSEEDERPTLINGIGVSAGIAEGIARVVLDPDFADIESGEILVAPTTNPSWSSVMFLSTGLVVDIGGALSHAAVVARELGLPCVVNTRLGSRVIRTGDRIRIDGSKGTVEILSS